MGLPTSHDPMKSRLAEALDVDDGPNRKEGRMLVISIP